jgi:uncharacterized protein (TIGR00369 family)
VSSTTRAAQFEELDPETRVRWLAYGRPKVDAPDVFPTLLGLRVEEVRRDYCRLRMPFRPELMQAGGVIHGGAVASLLDSVLVPAIGSSLPEGSRFATIDLHVQFMGAVTGGDVVAEGWVVRRGRRIVFGQAEARAGDSGELVATAMLTYHVTPPA